MKRSRIPSSAPVLWASLALCACTGALPSPRVRAPGGDGAQDDEPTEGPRARREPTECARRVRAGLAHYHAQRLEEARRSFEQAIARDARCAPAYVNLAILQRKAGELKPALANLRRALAIDARLLPAFNELALLYLTMADSDEELALAEVVCSQAQKIEADFAPLYNTWGLIDARRGAITTAAAKFQRALELDPSMFEAHMNFARIALSFRGYEDAEQALRKALQLRPKSFDARLGLGVAQRGLGQLEAAERSYQEAAELAEGRPEPYFNLGVLYQDFRSASRDDMLRAREYFKTFLQRAGDSPRYGDAVADVTRRCKPTVPGRGRRSRGCQVGRLQNIEQILEVLGGAQ